MTSASVQLDNQFHIETPEGIILSYQPAGIVTRFLAYAIDCIVRIVLYIVLYIVIAKLIDHELGYALLLLSWFFLNWLLMVFFEQTMNGQSPGKWLFKIQVVNQDGTRVSWGASLNRNLLRTVDFFPFGYAIGLSCMLVNRDFKRLGDITAHTVVVYIPTIKPIPLPPGEPLAPPYALNADEQEAIINFAQRYTTMSDARRDELAQLLLADDPNAQQTLINWAYHFSGLPANWDTHTSTSQRQSTLSSRGADE